MTDSETYRKGREVRRELMGEALVERMAKKGLDDDPIMKKFGDYASEAVFGMLWTRPGVLSEDAHPDLRCFGHRHRSLAGARHPPPDGAAPRLDRGRADRGAAAPVRLYRAAFGARGDDHGEGGLRRDAAGGWPDSVFVRRVRRATPARTRPPSNPPPSDADATSPQEVARRTAEREIGVEFGPARCTA